MKQADIGLSVLSLIPPSYLERDGIVERKVYAVVPPMVEYSLTPLGQTLIEPLCKLCKWAETNIPEIEAARDLYDNKGIGA